MNKKLPHSTRIAIGLMVIATAYAIGVGCSSAQQQAEQAVFADEAPKIRKAIADQLVCVTEANAAGVKEPLAIVERCFPELVVDLMTMRAKTAADAGAK